MFQTEIPSAEHVRQVLNGLSHAQMQELARLSEVPFTTLWKVRTGETADPRLETVRRFAPFVNAASAERPASLEAAA